MVLVDCNNFGTDSLATELNVDKELSLFNSSLDNFNNKNDICFSSIDTKCSIPDIQNMASDKDGKLAFISKATVFKGEDELHYIVNEIVETEIRYIDDLIFLRQNYLTFLVSEPVFNFLNYCLKNLICIHKQLYKKFITCYNDVTATYSNKIKRIAGFVSYYVSIYLYENYINTYHIVIKLLGKYNTSLIILIQMLNNVVACKNITDIQNSFYNHSFQALLQTPINRIMKYKIFLSKVLTDYVTEASVKKHIAIDLNTLLGKLDKINNFHLEYSTTLGTEPTIHRSRTASYRNGEDHSFKYNNIINRIDNTELKDININSFGTLLLTLPIIVLHLERVENLGKTRKSIFKRFMTTKEKTKSDCGLAIKSDTNAILLLFKSRLLVLEQANKKEYDLRIKFCIPLSLTELCDDSESAAVVDSKNTVKLSVSSGISTFEFFLSCWNKIEFENFNIKLKCLLENYNLTTSSNSTESTAANYTGHAFCEKEVHNELSLKKNKPTNQFKASTKEKPAFREPTEKNVAFKELIETSSVFKKFTEENDAIRQVVKPKNIVENDKNAECNNKLLFSDAAARSDTGVSVCFNFVNHLKYEEKHIWLWGQNDTLTQNKTNSSILVINAQDRVDTEQLLFKQHACFNNFDILRLSDYKKPELPFNRKTFQKLRTLRRSMSIRFFMFEKEEEGDSSTSTFNNSLIFLPKKETLDHGEKLRVNLINSWKLLNGTNYTDGSKAVRVLKFVNTAMPPKTVDVNLFADRKTTPTSSLSTSESENEKYISILNSFLIPQSEKTSAPIFANGYIKSDDTILNANNFTESMEKILTIEKIKTAKTQNKSNSTF